MLFDSSGKIYFFNHPKLAARTGAAGLGGGSVWPSGQPEIIVVMFDLISEGLAKHLVMPMGGHNVGVQATAACRAAAVGKPP